MKEADDQVLDLAPVEQAADEDVSYVIEFSRPYKFEGEEIRSVDLSGIENLTAKDMVAADKFLTRSGNFTVMPEMNLEYALFIAARASKRPVEFFQTLSPRDALKIKNRVTSFFYGED